MLQQMNLSSAHGDILQWLILLPALGSLLMLFVPRERFGMARLVGLIFSVAAFGSSLTLLMEFNPEFVGYQFFSRQAWVPSLGISYVLGIDGISIWFLPLTTLLTMLVIMGSGSVQKQVRGYIASLLLLETGVIGAFAALDLISFYVFWELMLIPMYFIIGIWGGQRRVYAALKFVLYTALGSLLMLVAIVYLGFVYADQYGSLSFYLGDWSNLNLTFREELWLFAAFALAFAIKVPIFPLHTWLPDAHVEAPTGGSVILAGVLLKLGLYGLIRFAMPLFPEALLYAAPLFFVLGVIGIVYGALMAWVQDDMKKLVAYSSVSHLGFCVIGFAAMNLQGLQGSVLQMISHGISTGALFFMVGVLYDRKHTRRIEDYGGLAAKVPVFAFIFLVFTLSSIGLPLTNGFVGEFLILFGSFSRYPLLAAVAVSGVVLGAVYMLSLYRRVMFGELDEQKNGDLSDISLREILVVSPLLVLVFVIGVFPMPILSAVEKSAVSALKFVEQVRSEETELAASDGFSGNFFSGESPTVSGSVDR
ncbi:MAG: NADH-quinone oxidoreductase subunit M, partial [bacterium]|nr:NADH-quinone oxidoreductase subunit M [bacterium]